MNNFKHFLPTQGEQAAESIEAAGGDWGVPLKKMGWPLTLLR